MDYLVMHLKSKAPLLLYEMVRFWKSNEIINCKRAFRNDEKFFNNNRIKYGECTICADSHVQEDSKILL